MWVLKHLYKFSLRYILLILLLLVIYVYMRLKSLNIENFEAFNTETRNTILESKSPKKIAFCFLIYDEINHKDLWEKFFEGVDHNKYNIYIHYKSNRSLGNFNKYKLSRCLDTKWADKSLVKASNLLFTTAFKKDSNNYKFVLLSNSCIPLKSFDYVYDFLTKDNNGYLNSFELEKCGYYCKSKFNQAYPHYLAKCSQWVILNRLLVERIASVDDEIIDQWFSDIWAPDEMFYYSFIKLNKLENQVVVSKFKADGATTFIYWNGMNYKYKDPKHEASNKVKTSVLKNYSVLDKEELDYLVDSKSLFGRKFNKDCIVVLDNNRKTHIKNYLSKFI